MKELEQFIEMSKYAGERFDLVQAGGGNTSVKLDSGKMYIKASGYLLSEVDVEKGYTTVDNAQVLEILSNKNIVDIKDKKLRDANASKAVLKTISPQQKDRPSIETFLHALLLKYTLHVHSISVNILTSHKNWEEQVKLLKKDILLIKYETPGIDLALEMKNKMELYLESHGNMPNVICLQNHGLIITSNNYEEITQITEDIVISAEKLCKINLKNYRATTILSKEINTISSKRNITYLVNDSYIKDILKTNREILESKPFCPDGYVFCGYKSLQINNSISIKEQIKAYLIEYKEIPKVIIYYDNIYIIAIDLKKAKMIEDVLKNNLMILNALGNHVNYLPHDEIKYLGNWDAEKYRQNL